MSDFALGAVLMIVSGSMHAVVNAVIKGGQDKAAARAVSDGVSALVALALLPFVAMPHGAWPYLVGSAVLHGAYLYALVRTYAEGDLSSTYPVLRGTAPLVVALVTVGLLGEDIRWLQGIGILVISLATLSMVVGRHLSAAALRWAALTGVLAAVCTVLDARGVRTAPEPLGYIAWLFVGVGVVVNCMFAALSRGAVYSAAARQWRPSVAAGILSAAGYGIALYALSLGSTAVLAALRETGLVMALVIAVVFLGEEASAGRVVGALGILLGSVLILAG